MCEICSGTVMGDKVGSTEIYFIPGEIRGGEFTADTHTAGCVCVCVCMCVCVSSHCNHPSGA